MTNADKFKEVFGLYATELWSKPEDEFLEWLNTLAEPELKKGKWQRRKNDDCWECSNCHAVLENDDLVIHNFYFCYHCGSDMRTFDGQMKLEGVNDEYTA